MKYLFLLCTMNKVEIACKNFFDKSEDEKNKVINTMVAFLDQEIHKHEPLMLGFLKTIELAQSFISKRIGEEKYEMAHVMNEAFKRIREKHGKTKITDIL